MLKQLERRKPGGRPEGAVCVQLNTLVLESWQDRSPHGLRGKLNRKLTIVSKHLTKMESIDGECNSQMKIPRSSE